MDGLAPAHAAPPAPADAIARSLQARGGGPTSRRLAGHTVYLGGSFDPAHWGHVCGGWALLMQDAQELWLAPTATHADKKNQCSYDLRLAQCQLVAQEIDRRLPAALRGRIRVSDVEARVDSGGQTVRVFEHLTQRWPERAFAFAIGSDCLAKAPGWDGWERLQQLAKVVVLDRPGYAGAHQNLLAEAMPPISSTEIRRRLAAGDPVDALMPTSVERLVRDQRLYGQEAVAVLGAGLQPPRAGVGQVAQHLGSESVAQHQGGASVVPPQPNLQPPLTWST